MGDSSFSVLQSLMDKQRGQPWTSAGLMELAAELHRHDYLWPFRAAGTGVAPGQVILQDSPEMNGVTDKHIVYYPEQDGTLIAPLFTDPETFAAMHGPGAQEIAFVKFRPFDAWSCIRTAPRCSATVITSGTSEVVLPLKLVKILREHYAQTMNDRAAEIQYMMDPDD